VYGTFSFFEKLTNGAFIQVVSTFVQEGEMVRLILVAVPGGSVILGLIISFTIVQYYQISKKKKLDEKKALLKRYLPDFE
jgi:hypothetical protein